MRLLADRRSPPPRRKAARALAGALGLASLLALATVPGTIQAQTPQEPPAAQAPAVPPPPAVAAPAPPARGSVPDEALEQIDRALEEVEQRIEEGADAVGDDADSAVIRARRERVREIREQVHRRLRQHTDRSDNKVAFGSSLHIEEGDVAGDAVAIGGSVEVDGDVDGDAVAIGGSVTVDGRVTGDVVAVGGSVKLGDDAEVLGEVISVGGGVERADGAEVMGRINEVGFGPNFTWNVGDTQIHWWDWKGHRRWSPFDFGWFGFGLSLIGVVVLLLLALLVRLVAGSTVERVRAKVIESPWLCGLVGLAIELFFLPVLVVVCVILAISIIGIPLLLLIPFVVLAFLVALVVGYTGVAQAVGEWTGGRFGRTVDSPYVALVVGVLVLQSLHVAGELFDSFDGILWFFAVMFGVVGFLVRYAAWTVGIGAVFLTAVRRSSPGAMLAAPPPPPAAPPPPVEPDYSYPSGADEI